MLKDYEFHPLSLDNNDFSADTMEETIADMRQHGFDPAFPIWLLDGKILEGRNRYKAAKAAGVKPVFETFKGTAEQAAAFVVRANDLRRHDDPEEQARKRRARIPRIAAARQEGKSLRTIAEEEGISLGQVQRDLKEATVSGDTVEPPNGKVTGKDGRSRPATQSKSETNGHANGRRVSLPDEMKKREQGKGKKPKPGKPIFDDRPFDQLFGKLTRFFDQRKTAYGFGAKDKVKEHQECMDAMGAVHAAWTRWQKATT